MADDELQVVKEEPGVEEPAEIMVVEENPQEDEPRQSTPEAKKRPNVKPAAKKPAAKKSAPKTLAARAKPEPKKRPMQPGHPPPMHLYFLQSDSEEERETDEVQLIKKSTRSTWMPRKKASDTQEEGEKDEMEEALKDEMQEVTEDQPEEIVPAAKRRDRQPFRPSVYWKQDEEAAEQARRFTWRPGSNRPMPAVIPARAGYARYDGPAQQAVQSEAFCELRFF